MSGKQETEYGGFQFPRRELVPIVWDATLDEVDFTLWGNEKKPRSADQAAIVLNNHIINIAGVNNGLAERVAHLTLGIGHTLVKNTVLDDPKRRGQHDNPNINVELGWYMAKYAVFALAIQHQRNEHISDRTGQVEENGIFPDPDIVETYRIHPDAANFLSTNLRKIGAGKLKQILSAYIEDLRNKTPLRRVIAEIAQAEAVRLGGGEVENTLLVMNEVREGDLNDGHSYSRSDLSIQMAAVVLLLADLSRTANNDERLGLIGLGR